MPDLRVRVLAAGGADAEAVAAGLADHLVLPDGDGPVAQIETMSISAPAGWRDLVEALRDGTLTAPDVLLLSMLNDLQTPPEQFAVIADELVDRIAKQEPCHILVLLLSTLDGEQEGRVGRHSGSYRAGRLDLAALELSSQRGVSVVDADRLIAESGGADRVLGIGRYTDDVIEQLVGETLRILDFYRFFESGTPIPQLETVS